jgi:hypothetical protein
VKINKPQQMIAAFALTVAVVSANAASVTTTGSFTQLTMGGFASGGSTFANGLRVNGQAIDVCGTDSTCASAISNPTSITTTLSGSSVAFGYNNTFRPNAFSFTSNTADVAGVGASNQFTLGTFTFTNGGFYPLVFFDFTLTTQSSDAALNNQTFSGRIRLDSNSTQTDPGPGIPLATVLAEADYFTVQSSAGSTLTSMGSARVYDYNFCPAGDLSAPACNIGSVDLIGHINSLHLDSFANPTGGAFINSSTTSALAPVPEPETYALMLAGLGLVGFIARSRRNFSA